MIVSGAPSDRPRQLSGFSTGPSGTARRPHGQSAVAIKSVTEMRRFDLYSVYV